MTIGEQLKYEGMQKGIQKRIRQGLQQGKHIEAMAIARNLRIKGFDPNLIKEVTGLTEQDYSRV